jgi:hypothetical protein
VGLAARVDEEELVDGHVEGRGLDFLVLAADPVEARLAGADHRSHQRIVGAPQVTKGHPGLSQGDAVRR